MNEPMQVVAPPKVLPTILEETLLVEITDENVGTDVFGVKRTMVMSRAAFNQQKADTPMRVVKILKPEGVTMQQQIEADAKKVAAPKPVTTKTPTAPKTAAAKTTTSKAFVPPKKVVPSVEEVIGADTPLVPTEDELKAQIENESMQELLNSVNPVEEE